MPFNDQDRYARELGLEDGQDGDRVVGNRSWGVFL
eukprot:COSAG06_NODE_1238_length_10133_cov_3382.190452_11_plen_35_part_00